MEVEYTQVENTDLEMVINFLRETIDGNPELPYDIVCAIELFIDKYC